MTAAPATPALDVLVIGGGQAGLAMGYHLARRGLHFQIVDAGAEVGAAWRSRWDSLRAFTPAQYDNLPGFAFPAAPDTYPGKDDVAGYLQAYAAHFGLAVRPSTMVTSLTRSNGVYVARTRAGAWQARQVVVATGPFQVPFIPPIATELDAGVCQLHSVEYRNPATMPPGRILVVGAANSGCQIAEELAATHRVELAAGRWLPAIPQRPLGRDVWWWASMLGLDQVTARSRLGRRLAGRDQVIGGGPRQLARRHGVRIGPARRARPAGQCGSPTGPGPNSTRWYGRPASRPTTPGSTSPASRTSGDASCTSVASRPRPACTCWALPGSTPEPRRCWAGCGTTRTSSPSRSRPAQMNARTQARLPAPPPHRRTCGQPADAGLSVPEQGITMAAGTRGTR